MALTLLDLPDELIESTCSFSEMSAVKPFRLACRRIAPLAHRRLFSHLHISPTKESAIRAREILDDARLRPLVNKITIKASVDTLNHAFWKLDDDNMPYSDTKPHWVNNNCEVPSEFKKIVANLGGFQNLRRVELKHDYETEGPSQEAYNGGNNREWWDYRKQFFRKCMAGLHSASNLRSLSIENYQDIVDVELATSAHFTSVLSRLDSLELGVAVDRYEASPESAIEFPERHKFFSRDLTKYWLEPIQDQLVHLKIYCSDYWGYIPKCDLRSLRFPKLESLSLGNMTFTHDWQMDWILSHGATLKALTLDDCPIVQASEVTGPLDPENYPVFDLDQYQSIFFNGPDCRWTFEARWHEYLQKMKVEMSNLRYFGIGHGPWESDEAFEAAHRLPARLDPGRYMIFQCGTGPSQWIEPTAARYERSGWTENDMDLENQYNCCWHKDQPLPRYPACTEDDRQALKELLEVIRARQE